MAKRFTTALQTLFAANQELTDTACALYDVASECDRLEAKLHENAVDLAEKFRRYGEEIAAGRYATPPTGYSHLRDLDGDAATYKARAEELVRLVRLVLGKEKAAMLREALEESTAAPAPTCR